MFEGIKRGQRRVDCVCLESEKTEMKRVSGSHVLSIVVPASSVSVKFEVSLTGGGKEDLHLCNREDQ